MRHITNPVILINSKFPEVMVDDITKANESHLYIALNAAINMLSVYEHGDSRCVSDEFVSLCMVSMGGVNQSCISILRNTCEIDYSMARAEYQDYINSQVTITRRK